MTETLPILFFVTSLIVIITPGQDMILVMSRSVAQGWKGGVVTAAGVSTGLLGHTVLATLGLGALLSASQFFFSVIKLIGAAYLIYLGIKLLCSSSSQLELHGLPAASLRRLFFQGAISNISNPKVAIFYFAFLPQFVPADSVHPTTMLFVLGVLFAILTFVVKGPIGYSAGIFSGWLRSRPVVLKWINRCSGSVLVALGLKLALEKSN